MDVWMYSDSTRIRCFDFHRSTAWRRFECKVARLATTNGRSEARAATAGCGRELTDKNVSQVSTLTGHSPILKGAIRERLFDHLVRAQQHRLRDCDSQRLRGLEVDEQLEPRGLFDR
jgi:hypothetical protein